MLETNLWLENRTNLLREDGVTPLILETSTLLTESGDDFVLQSGTATLDLEK